MRPLKRRRRFLSIIDSNSRTACKLAGYVRASTQNSVKASYNPNAHVQRPSTVNLISFVFG
jgi:hypothetical protein